MIYLSGGMHQSVMERPDMGYMLTARMGNKLDLRNTLWAADTGCFSSATEFDLDKYISFLESNPQRTCLFATAPDVVGDSEKTWEKSKDVLPILRSLGYRAALVAQDGLEDPEWDSFDCLFVGGTTEWKLSEKAYRLARMADERGKWVHMGRVNSWKRIKAALVSGYDSVDGTYLKFGPDQLFPRLESWLDTIRKNPVMEIGDTK